MDRTGAIGDRDAMLESCDLAELGFELIQLRTNGRNVVGLKRLTNVIDLVARHVRRRKENAIRLFFR